MKIVIYGFNTPSFIASSCLALIDAPSFIILQYLFGLGSLMRVQDPKCAYGPYILDLIRFSNGGPIIAEVSFCIRIPDYNLFWNFPFFMHFTTLLAWKGLLPRLLGKFFWVTCSSLVSIRMVIYYFFNVCPFDYTVFVIIGKVVIP